MDWSQTAFGNVFLFKPEEESCVCIQMVLNWTVIILRWHFLIPINTALKQKTFMLKFHVFITLLFFIIVLICESRSLLEQTKEDWESQKVHLLLLTNHVFFCSSSNTEGKSSNRGMLFFKTHYNSLFLHQTVISCETEETTLIRFPVVFHISETIRTLRRVSWVHADGFTFMLACSGVSEV